MNFILPLVIKEMLLEIFLKKNQRCKSKSY